MNIFPCYNDMKFGSQTNKIIISGQCTCEVETFLIQTLYFLFVNIRMSFEFRKKSTKHTPTRFDSIRVCSLNVSRMILNDLP